MSHARVQRWGTAGLALVVGWAARAGGLPDLAISLGTRNEGAGIRITNEGSDYANNFTLTREVATATRAYGTFCGFEPASGVDATGNVARIHNAAASGARQLHVYTDNVLGDAPLPTGTSTATG